MDRWLTQAHWIIAKDVLLTFGGLALIVAEVFFIRPVSDLILVTGLAMTGIGASFHLGAIASGFIGQPSSSSRPGESSSGSPHSRGSSDER